MVPLIVYDSLTGNVQRFVSKLKYQSVKITENLEVKHPYILVTYTTGFGEVPKTTLEFLSRNSLFLLGISGSGNKNWGNTYCQSAKTISKNYKVPIVHTFELSGTEEDVIFFEREVEKLCQKIKSQSGLNTIMK